MRQQASSRPRRKFLTGFERAHICDARNPPEDLALDAARAALSDAGLQPSEVDVLVWASARPESHVRSSGGAGSAGFDVMHGFRYTSAWLQNVLELHNADVLAVAQQGCSTMFAAVRVARSLLLAEPGRRHALCVGVDVLPDGAPREILYNLISDAACAVVVYSQSVGEVARVHTAVSRVLARPAACGREIVAAYFPTAKAVIERLLVEHGLQAEDIDVVVPTGVNRSSWDILLRLVGISADRLHAGLPSFGHTITADSFLYLQDLRRRGEVPRGSRLLLFTYGFGSSWCGLLLEH